MKKYLLIIFFLLNFQLGFGQIPCGIFDFENPYHGDWCFVTGAWFDSSSLINQVWQIGHPQKTIFDSAYTLPNAIVTKLDTSYPPNDTSSFIFRELVTVQLTWPNSLYISGYFKINSDSLSDYGYIEFSPDNGISWYKITPWIYDSTGYSMKDSIFTGDSKGWASFAEILGSYPFINSVQPGDTVAYRFTFISDSIQTNKEGWLLDNIGFDFVGEGVPEIQNNDLISIFPNPVDRNIFIQRTKESDKAVIQIFNNIGQTIIYSSNFKDNTIDTKQMRNGFYLLKYSDLKSYCIKKFIVQH